MKFIWVDNIQREETIVLQSPRKIHCKLCSHLSHVFLSFNHSFFCLFSAFSIFFFFLYVICKFFVFVTDDCNLKGYNSVFVFFFVKCVTKVCVQHWQWHLIRNSILFNLKFAFLNIAPLRKSVFVEWNYFHLLSIREHFINFDIIILIQFVNWNILKSIFLSSRLLLFVCYYNVLLWHSHNPLPLLLPLIMNNKTKQKIALFKYWTWYLFICLFILLTCYVFHRLINVICLVIANKCI